MSGYSQVAQSSSLSGYLALTYTCTVFPPREFKVEVSVVWMELPIVVIVMTALIPMIIPSIVKIERILLLKMLVTASFIFSKNISAHLPGLI